MSCFMEFVMKTLEAQLFMFTCLNKAKGYYFAVISRYVQKMQKESLIIQDEWFYMSRIDIY